MSEFQNPFAPSAPPDSTLAESDIPHLETPQSVRFAHTAESVAAFWSHRTHSSTSDRKTRRNNLLTAGCLLIMAPITLAVFAAMQTIPAFIGLLALCYTLLIVLWFLNSLRPRTIDAAILREAHRIVDEAPNLQLKGERTMTLEQEGVRQKLRYGETFFRWAAYERIEQTDHHAFFYESSMTAVIVPRSAFGSQSQFLGFVRLAQRLWQEHRAATDQPSPNADAV